MIIIRKHHFDDIYVINKLGRPKKNNPKFKIGDKVKVVKIDGNIYSSGVVEEVLYSKGNYQYRLNNKDIISENELKFL